MNSKRVLVLATSRLTRGGVTAVVKAHQQSPFWKTYRMYWLETHIDRGKIAKLFFAITAFIKYLFLIRQFDLVHIHTSELPSVRRKYFFISVAHLLKKKIIIHLHIGNQIESVKTNRLYIKLFNEADAIIVLSQQAKQRLVDIYNLPDDKVNVTYNPCPDVENVNYNPDSKQIIFAGTLNRNKGYSVLINAFAKVAFNYPEWKLKLAGNGEIKEAQRLISELGIAGQTDLLGWVKGDKKDQLFRHASIFCLASYAEGFPMAVLDAWAYALPVITTPVGGLPEILTDNDNALFFEPGNINQLAEKLDQLMSSRELRIELSARSRSLATGQFSRERMNEDISSLYAKLLGK